jgi:hypothetical protein
VLENGAFRRDEQDNPPMAPDWPVNAPVVRDKPASPLARSAHCLDLADVHVLAACARSCASPRWRGAEFAQQLARPGPHALGDLALGNGADVDAAHGHLAIPQAAQFVQTR